jgi:hypothetical protein
LGALDRFYVEEL